MDEQKVATVDDYINTLSGVSQEYMIDLRCFLKGLLPNATDEISYSMPALRDREIVLWYKASAKHYAIYPYAKSIAHFAADLAEYSTSKGTIRFDYKKPIPESLIKKIVAFRMAEIEAKTSVKKTIRSAKK